ncbi:MAG: hypothetical protein ABI594_09880 [Ginsengibacter sp.]
MKQIAAILLLLLLSWQMVYKAGYIVYWKLDQSILASKYCENKAKPQLHCNGKCYLQKQLNKADTGSRQKEMPLSVSRERHIDNFIVENNYRPCFAYKVHQSQHAVCVSGLLLPGHLHSFLQPPDFNLTSLV